jgi:hypothetical protein
MAVKKKTNGEGKEVDAQSRTSCRPWIGNISGASPSRGVVSVSCSGEVVDNTTGEWRVGRDLVCVPLRRLADAPTQPFFRGLLYGGVNP